MTADESAGWREEYRALGVDPDGWAKDPLDGLRDREGELEQIAESDAPDAPVARVMLALLEGEDVPADAMEALTEDEARA